MRLTQMFPSQKLDAEDLEAFNPGVTIVTIEAVTYRTLEAARPGEAEIEYALKFREFRKPVRLSKTRAQTIGDVLGTDETDEWIGKTIGILPARILIYDQQTKRQKSMTIVSIDIQRPLTPPTLAPNTDITGASTQKKLAAKAVPSTAGALPGAAGGGGGGGGGGAAAAPAVLGIDQAAVIVASLRQRNKTWDDFVAYLKNAGMGEAVAGKLPADCPASVLPIARTFVTSFPKIKDVDIAAESGRIKAMWAPPPSAEPAEVIDKTTGEVIKPAAGNFPPTQAADDIPF